MKGNLNRTFLFLICAILLLLTVACSGDSAKLKKMQKYYNNSDNYIVMQGQIITLRYYRESDSIVLHIDIDEPNPNFVKDYETDYYVFEIKNWTNMRFDINEGDVIGFASAPHYFFDGQKLPIMQIYKDGNEILTFEKGRDNYLTWIENEFS